MSFRIVALPYATFAPLFDLSEAALAAAEARLVVAGPAGGYPCRVSLTDAAPGERLVLVNYEHQPAATPFRARHAVYVREGAIQARPAAGEVPTLFRSRLLSLRAFDATDMMVDADVVAGTEAGPTIDRLFADPAVAYLHAHYAKPGCYAARVERA